MNWFKASAAAFGVFITVVAASPDANATTITPSERVSFGRSTPSLNAPGGSASVTLSPNVAANKVIDGQVQIDATNIEYWWKRRSGQNGYAARREAAKAWNFTLTHAGQTADLGGLTGAVQNHWFKTTAFDGLTASGDWILTATSNYYNSAKRMIKFDLAGFFFTKDGPVTGGGTPTTPGGGTPTPGGGSVPVPAPFLLILAGLAGIAATRRKA